MNIAIVDDRKEDREKLVGILLKYVNAGNEKMNIQHFESAEALLDNYQPFLYNDSFSGHLYGWDERNVGGRNHS